MLRRLRDLDLKQSYCRDLRDCQTYFPCAVFSSGFSYLYVIKRCPNEQIFDEKKQTCVRNTFTDPTCAKKVANKKSRLTSKRPTKLEQVERSGSSTRRPGKLRFHAASNSQLKRKNIDVEDVDTTTELPNQLLVQQINEDPKVQRVCYITNWSRYRPGEAKFELEYIDPHMCTHIIYAYATVDEDKPEIIPIQKDDIGK